MVENSTSESPHPVGGLPVHLLSRAKTKAQIGFSWAYLFIGFLEALRRGEREVAVLHALLTLATLGAPEFDIYNS